MGIIKNKTIIKYKDKEKNKSIKRRNTVVIFHLTLALMIILLGVVGTLGLSTYCILNIIYEGQNTEMLRRLVVLGSMFTTVVFWGFLISYSYTQWRIYTKDGECRPFLRVY